MKTTKRLLACMLSLLLFLTAVPARPALAAKAGVPYITTGDVYMRAKASKSSDAITTLKKGTKITVTNTSHGKWYKATYKNKKGKTFTGYVSNKYLKKNTKKNAKKKTKKKAAAKGVTYITTGDVYMRSKASKNSKIVTTLTKGTAITVTNTSHGKWYKATYKNKKGKTFSGYVSNKYLKKKGAAAKAVTYITTGNVYMRSGASKSSKIVTTLAKGTAITVTDTSHGKWYKAVYIDKNKDSHTGFVSNKYLKKK